MRWRYGEKCGGIRGDGGGRKPRAIYNSHLHNGINRTSVCIQWCEQEWEGGGGRGRGDVDQEKARQVQEYTCLTG